MYYVYLLKSKFNNEIYVGSTNDLNKRVHEHNSGKEISTKRYMPWEFVYYESYNMEELARKREQKLKHHGNAMKEVKKRSGLYKSGAGFTLIETMVAVFIFTLLIGGGIGLLISSFSAQKTAFSLSQAVREEANTLEYVGRSLRQAQKDLGPTCLAVRGDNFNLINGASGIKFITHDGLCDQFLLAGSQIMEQKSSGPQIALTSTNVQVSALKFTLLGQSQTDQIQPRVTVSMMINGISSQTSVSQRNFDIQQ